jgi:hypothetical protein
MISKQMINGNKGENSVLPIFKKYGYWCHNFAKGKAGEQPVDIIALKKNISWLADVKYVRVEDASFPISRIEPNQWACFDYARNFAGIENLGIIICSERADLRPLFISYDKLLEMKKTGQKSIKISDLKGLEELL